MRNQILSFIFLCLFLIAAPTFATEDSYPFTSANEAQRFLSLTQEIRCVVCQNQNIADSNAPLASDLRTKVYQMVLAKKSNQEIKSYLVKRYGEFILLEPSFSKLTLLLWLFPFIGLLIILGIFARYARINKPSHSLMD